MKDSIYYTDHPDQALISITVNWNDPGTGIDLPSAYMIETDGIKEAVSTDTDGMSFLLDPGSYEFCFYNSLSRLPVTERVAKVSRVSTPEDSGEPFIDPAPGWLFTAVKEYTVEKDSEYEETVEMQQQVRRLTLLLTPEGTLSGQIVTLQGTLSGVAGAFSISDGTYSEPSCVELNFTPQTEGEDESDWGVTMELLGVTGEGQILTILVTLDDPLLVPVRIECDLSPELADFNKDKKILLRSPEALH